MALTHALSVNNYGVSHLIVATSAANGTHTTLGSAMADAVSGDTIFLRDSVTENVTLTAGVNIACWEGGTLNTPTITGTLTMTTAGTCNISGIILQTNSAAILAVTGSAASIVNLYNCYLNCTNNTGITFSSSSSSSSINMRRCNGNLGTTGIGLFSHSSAGVLNLFYSSFSNSGLSTTSSTCSAGNLGFLFSQISFPITTSSTGIILATYTTFSSGAVNTTALTCNGGSSSAVLCDFNAGTASALSIGGTIGLTQCTIGSSNSDAIAGAGVVTYSNISFSGSSRKINVTTIIGGVSYGGLVQAPSAGFIGERIENTATSVAMTSGAAKTVTSINLTAGVWDISAIALTVASGGAALAQALVVNISTTDNTIVGTGGIQTFQTNVSAVILSGSVPSLRVTLTANTTYYLVCNVFYTSTTAPTNGRISATRVG